MCFDKDDDDDHHDSGAPECDLTECIVRGVQEWIDKEEKDLCYDKNGELCTPGSSSTTTRGEL